MTQAQVGVRSAQRLLETLHANGVTHVFGVPGAKIDAVFDALTDSPIDLVVCRHEQNAAFMAAAVGRLTGHPGVVVATSGPGTGNLVTGLLTANTEQDPVVAICGAVQRADRSKRTHQTMDAAQLLQVVTKYTAEATVPENVPEVTSNALRAAMTEPRGAAAIVLPADVAAEPTPASMTVTTASAPMGPAPAESITRAADLIRAAARPVLLVGMRAANELTAASVRRLIEDTDLPVVETFQAAGVLSRSSERHFVGRVGLFRNQPGDVMIAHADVLVTIGYDPVEYDPDVWNAGLSRAIVHIDSIGAALDNDYRPALELRGDVAATLDRLTTELGPLAMGAPFTDMIADQRSALDAVDERARRQPDSDLGVDPGALALMLREALDDDAVVACDIGSNYIYMARHFRAYRPRTLLFSNGQQTLGVGLPWAMAAALIRPGRQVVSVSGDGGFLFSAQELETATRLGLTFTHVLMRDNTYDMVGFQELMKYGRTSGVELGDYDVPSLAAAFGAHGYRVRSSVEFQEVLAKALAEEGPSVIDVAVDYSRNVHLGASLHPDVFE
jgi:acetolactate synthase-1/2/3 large subunit